MSSQSKSYEDVLAENFPKIKPLIKPLISSDIRKLRKVLLQIEREKKLQETIEKKEDLKKRKNIFELAVRKVKSLGNPQPKILSYHLRESENWNEDDETLRLRIYNTLRCTAMHWDILFAMADMMQFDLEAYLIQKNIDYRFLEQYFKENA